MAKLEVGNNLGCLLFVGIIVGGMVLIAIFGGR